MQRPYASARFARTQAHICTETSHLHGLEPGRCAVRKTYLLLRTEQVNPWGLDCTQQRVIFVNNRIADYYFIFVQSYFSLLGFGAIRSNKLLSLSVKFRQPL